jgi:hypothetical protein
MYAGPYLKCGNGTLAVKQRIAISTTEKKAQHWYAPGKKGYNILIQPESRKTYKTATLGWAHGFKFEKPSPKGPPPSDDNPPPKGAPASDFERGEQPTATPGGTSTEI